MTDQVKSPLFIYRTFYKTDFKAAFHISQLNRLLYVPYQLWGNYLSIFYLWACGVNGFRMRSTRELGEKKKNLIMSSPGDQVRYCWLVLLHQVVQNSLNHILSLGEYWSWIILFI